MVKIIVKWDYWWTSAYCSLPHLRPSWLATRATSDDGNDEDDKDNPDDNASDVVGNCSKDEYKLHL